MPEGPEVWILSNAINRYVSKYNASAYGKHLIFEKNELETTIFYDIVYMDWSFGLTGKVHIDGNALNKVNAGFAYGNQYMSHNKNVLTEKLGVSWMHASKEQLQTVVNSWIGLNRALATLLLDQSQISGIGVAWGSEILWKAGLRPNNKARNQNLSNLVNTLIDIRNEVQQLYSAELEKTSNVENFINTWFNNLYNIRNMNVYKIGTPIKVAGRTWWV